MLKSFRPLLVLLMALASGAACADVVSITHTWTGSEAVQGPNRLARNGIESVAGTQKAFPGTIGNNPTYFSIYAFDAAAGSVVSVDENVDNDLNSFFSIYSGLFNPGNLALNYLGDAGASGAGKSFSVNAPSSGHLYLVANSVNGTAAIGALASATLTFTSAVPEPASLALFGLAAGGLLVARRRRA